MALRDPQRTSATPPAATLAELGEQGILEQLVVPRFQSENAHGPVIGDDCAVVPPPEPGELLVSTIDPCPRPVVFELGDVDFWYFGWLTMLINVSDLAAMGATPMGLLVSTVMPGSMTAADYDRFLQGLSDAGRTWFCPVLGGNIKDGPEFTATAAAFGRVRADRVLRRTGAALGDAVCVVGSSGLFWAAVLRALHGTAVPLLAPDEEAALSGALRRPVAQVRAGQLLARTGGLTSCTDASDGLGSALSELARLHRADVVVASDALAPHPAAARVADALGVDPRKLALSWGNWELVCTMPPGRLAAVREALGPTAIRRVGTIRPGPGRLVLEQDGRSRPLADFGSRRFDARSTFSHGLKPYAELLMEGELYDTGVADRP